MNARGTYGNGHGTNGHSALGHRTFETSVVGAECSAVSTWASRFGSLLLSMGLGGVTGHFIAKDPNKGFGLGVVGGFFAHLMMEQTSLLRRINHKLLIHAVNGSRTPTA